MRARRLLPLTVAAALLAPAGATPLTAPAEGAQRITSSGVGAVKLGRTYRSLRAAGLVGKARPGCPLGGPGTRFARLRAPLSGSVDLTQGSPRRVAAITIRAGATARGVRVGAPRAAIRGAFPRARFDRSTEALFGITLASVPRGGGGPLDFAVDTGTREVSLIAVPGLAFCE